MTQKDNHGIPMVPATVVSSTAVVEVPSTAEMVVQVQAVGTTATAMNEFQVPLPIGKSLDFLFHDHGVPRISEVTNPDYHHLVGYYVHRILLPNLEISGIDNVMILRQTLARNQHANRTLVLIPHEPQQQMHGALYSHEIPFGESLVGKVRFKRFPPVVESVLDGGWQTRVVPGQAVHAVVVPGQPTLMMQSGGFTAYRVDQLLQNSTQVPGRRLVLKDRPEILNCKDGDNDAFDFKGCFIQ